MDLYRVDQGKMKPALRDYEFRQSIKYAFCYVLGLGSAHILDGLTLTPWLGMIAISLGILWAGRYLVKRF